MQSGFWPEQARGLLEKLGIEHPIIQAPMAGGPSTPELVAAVSNAGGLGSIGAGYLSPEQIDSEIRKVKELTKQPFSVNLFIPEANNAYTPSDKVIKKLEGFSKELGVDPPEIPGPPKYTFEDQLAVIVDNKVPVFSFTFGILEDRYMKELHKRKI